MDLENKGEEAGIPEAKNSNEDLKRQRTDQKGPKLISLRKRAGEIVEG
jgi:hypothetical protein